MTVKTCLNILYLLICSIIITSYNTTKALAGVEIKHFDGMIDWEKESNYAEAKQILQMAKDINKEKRRRKQLKDAGVPENEIKKIIQNEKHANVNNHLSVSSAMLQNTDDGTHASERSLSDIKETNRKTADASDDDASFTINDYDNRNKNNNNDNKQSAEKDNSHKSSSNNIETRTIDLSIVPDVPISKYAVSHAISNNQRHEVEYDDFELSRMLHKVGENTNNSKNFSLFAKEVAKIAVATNKNTELTPPPIEEFIIDDGTTLYEANRKQYGKYAKKTQEISTYNTTHRQTKQLLQRQQPYTSNRKNMYALSKTQKSIIKNDNNDVNQEQILYQMDENDNSANAEAITNITMKTNNLSDKQIQAKNIGAPQPNKRADVVKMKQYQPQNISQIAYDKNNKHLKPTVFESHVVEQVFDNLGTENAIPLARSLINKFGDANIADDDGNTLLMHAVARKNQSLIAMLLSEGASPNTLNKEGFAPIHLAASNGDNTAIYSLMMSGGQPNLVDNNGNTALMYASKMCNASSIKIMLSLGGDPTLTNRSTGKTALDFANENENQTIVSLLEQAITKTQGKRKAVNLTTY